MHFVLLWWCLNYSKFQFSYSSSICPLEPYGCSELSSSLAAQQHLVANCGTAFSITGFQWVFSWVSLQGGRWQQVQTDSTKILSTTQTVIEKKPIPHDLHKQNQMCGTVGIRHFTVTIGDGVNLCPTGCVQMEVLDMYGFPVFECKSAMLCGRQVETKWI